jgi:16S rRNA (cytidine1402-2'-O)-methyltransferase
MPRQKIRPATEAEEPDRTYCIAGHTMPAPRLVAGLHVVATPIGNLRDMTLRALETLAAADVIACEDTRVTRKLLDHYAIGTSLTPYHDHNAATARPKLLARMQAGEAVALVSDAGTPLISDPGYKLVRAAQEAGHLVTTAPGASSVMAALAVAGLPTDRFHFEGFLPPKDAARRRRLEELRRHDASLIFFETGPRLYATLSAMAEAFGVREAAICRELTKLHEEIVRGDPSSLAEAYAGDNAPRGEIVIIVGPASEVAVVEDVDALLRNALRRGSVRDAIAEVSSATGLARGDIYRRALQIVEGEDGAAAEPA